MISVVISVASAVILAALGLTWRSLAKVLSRFKALDGGVKCLLRGELIRAYNHYMDKGYLPIYARENIDDTYNAYHGLGGDGAITDMMAELKKLPTRKEAESEG